MLDPEFVVTALSVQMPPVMRWAGAIAKRLRGHNIALTGKQSGSASTDALTLADLTIQELLVAALRDTDPIFRYCRIEAEESTGDLARFPEESELVLALDPIDGTKQYRDRTGNGYAVMLHLRNATDVLYSLVYIPEKDEPGWWVEAHEGRIACGPDDPSRPAVDAVRSLPTFDASSPRSNSIYIIGFQHREAEAARQVTAAGLKGVASDDMPGSIYELMAQGTFGGSLIHSPNVYDFPVSLQLARLLGGDAVWVHNGEAVHFRETWLDDRADMLRLPGIVACSPDRKVLDTLVSLAKDWQRDRYHPHPYL
ncbi:MAG TPA: inositol monophosphatase family protein [Planctomycetaceae bacterium]|nr:inositol monophosphatase family protein [Planctomycetaceae bacterium]